jgi:hypothetical protein
MGAEFNCRTFNEADKAAVQSQWDNAVESDLWENGHSYSGGIGMLKGPIQWRRERFATRDEAAQFICDNHEKWQPALAVGCGDGWMVGGWCSS